MIVTCSMGHDATRLLAEAGETPAGKQNPREYADDSSRIRKTHSILSAAQQPMADAQVAEFRAVSSQRAMPDGPDIVQSGSSSVGFFGVSPRSMGQAARR